MKRLAPERHYSDPRWYKIEDIQKNKWTLKANATLELLEKDCCEEAGEKFKTRVKIACTDYEY